MHSGAWCLPLSAQNGRTPRDRDRTSDAREPLPEQARAERPVAIGAIAPGVRRAWAVADVATAETHHSLTTSASTRALTLKRQRWPEPPVTQTSIGSTTHSSGGALLENSIVQRRAASAGESQ